MENNKIVELGIKYSKARETDDEAKAKQKDTAAAKDEAKEELIAALIEAQTKSITIEGIGRLTLTTEKYPSVNAANRPLFLTYLEESGHEGLIKRDVNPATLNSFLKKHIVELELQLEEDGVTELQQRLLAQVDPDKYAGIAVGFKPDAMDAEEMAIDVIKARGAAIFTERNITLKKG